jgi:hypothetical protein
MFARSHSRGALSLRSGTVRRKKSHTAAVEDNALGFLRQGACPLWRLKIDDSPAVAREIVDEGMPLTSKRSFYLAKDGADTGPEFSA